MYKLEDIAKECGVQKDAILAFIKYRIEYNMPVPQPEPYQSSKYVYSDESAKEIIELFKNKKYGEMSEYNYNHRYGKAFREKHKREKKTEK